MKRERENDEDQALNNVVNSPRRKQPGEVKAITGAQAPKFALLFKQPNVPLTPAALLGWKRRWNAFLILYLNSLIHSENPSILVSRELEQLRTAKQAFASQNLDIIEKPADQESVFTALKQCDLFAFYSLDATERQDIPTILNTLSRDDKRILANYEILKLTLIVIKRLVEDLSVNPTYGEYIGLMLEIRQDIIPAFTEHLRNMSEIPARIEKRITNLKDTSLRPYFVALLQERKQSYIKLIEKLNASLDTIMTYGNKIEAAMQEMRDASNVMADMGDESLPTNTAPSNC